MSGTPATPDSRHACRRSALPGTGPRSGGCANRDQAEKSTRLKSVRAGSSSSESPPALAAATLTARHGHTPGEELALYLVHGWLHLADCDDTTGEARIRMRADKQAALTRLREAEALPAWDLPPGA
ncbi:MAG: rRNA maturation RNAse YbeY [Opitutales bacterium]